VRASSVWVGAVTVMLSSAYTISIRLFAARAAEENG
jgi:hypothetical protein